MQRHIIKSPCTCIAFKQHISCFTHILLFWGSTGTQDKSSYWRLTLKVLITYFTTQKSSLTTNLPQWSLRNLAKFELNIWQNFQHLFITYCWKLSEYCKYCLLLKCYLIFQSSLHTSMKMVGDTIKRYMCMYMALVNGFVWSTASLGPISPKCTVGYIFLQSAIQN